MVFGGEEEPKRKVSKYSEKEAIWYVGMRRRRRKKKKEKKDYVRGGKVKQRRKERKIFWRSKMSRWTDRHIELRRQCYNSGLSDFAIFLNSSCPP